MFKPTNPQIKILKQEITQIERLLLEAEGVLHQIDETKHKIENFNSFISNMEEIAYLMNLGKQSINKLQNQLNNISTKSLKSFINLLENEAKSKKQLVQKMIDEDFYSFMETMNEENTMEVYLSSDTATTPIMDEFYNSPKIDFLIFRHFFFRISLIVIKDAPITTLQISAPTMTELKTYSKRKTSKRIQPLIEELIEYDCSKMNYGQKAIFKAAFPLGGQTYANQTGYGWEWDWSDGYGDYTEGTYYGEVTNFLIVGFIYEKNYIDHSKLDTNVFL